MSRRRQPTQPQSEAQSALDDLAAVFWRAALAEVEKQLDEEDNESPKKEADNESN